MIRVFWAACLLLLLVLVAGPLIDPPIPCEAAPALAMPVKSAEPSLTPMPTERVDPVFPAPTAVSGAELAWPKLHLGETGVVSHYGSICPTCVALPFPWGSGWRVTIAGPGGTWSGVSNDIGPDRSLHRIADLGLPIWKKVCGVPPSVGLCTATVIVTGRR